MTTMSPPSIGKPLQRCMAKRRLLLPSPAKRDDCSPRVRKSYSWEEEGMDSEGSGHEESLPLWRARSTTFGAIWPTQQQGSSHRTRRRRSSKTTRGRRACSHSPSTVRSVNERTIFESTRIPQGGVASTLSSSSSSAFSSPPASASSFTTTAHSSLQSASSSSLPIAPSGSTPRRTRNSGETPMATSGPQSLPTTASPANKAPAQSMLRQTLKGTRKCFQTMGTVNEFAEAADKALRLHVRAELSGGGNETSDVPRRHSHDTPRALVRNGTKRSLLRSLSCDCRGFSSGERCAHPDVHHPLHYGGGRRRHGSHGHRRHTVFQRGYGSGSYFGSSSFDGPFLHIEEKPPSTRQDLQWLKCANCNKRFIGNMTENQHHHTAVMSSSSETASPPLLFCSGECRFSLALRSNHRHQREQQRRRNNHINN